MSTSVGVVLLAAEYSETSGTLKQLLRVKDKPAILCCLDAIISGGLSDIAVVVDDNSWEVAAAIKDYPVCIVVNDDPGRGMSELVNLGVQALPGYITGVITALIDYPLVMPETYARLESIHHRIPDYAIIPKYYLQIGHPALFPIDFYWDSSHHWFHQQPIVQAAQRVRNLPTLDPGVVLDLETISDCGQKLPVQAEV